MMKSIRGLSFIGLLLCCLSSAQAQSASHAAALAYQFGVFPYLSPSRIEQFLTGIGCRAFEPAQDADYDTVRAYARRLGLAE
jgi:hypothetical protein